MLLFDSHVHYDTHVSPMGNYVNALGIRRSSLVSSMGTTRAAHRDAGHSIMWQVWLVVFFVFVGASYLAGLMLGYPGRAGSCSPVLRHAGLPAAAVPWWGRCQFRFGFS